MISCCGRESRFTPVVDLMKKWSIHAGGVLPLTTVHRRLGVLLLGNDKAEGYSPEDICFLSLAADQRASAIDYAVNSRASQVAEDRLKPLWDPSNSVVSKLERRDRLWLVIDTISALVRTVLPDSSTDFIDRALENEDSP
jgi:GAF domain-containing protein